MIDPDIKYKATIRFPTRQFAFIEPHEVEGTMEELIEFYLRNASLYAKKESEHESVPF